MAIVQEIGLGDPNSNSYVSSQQVADYWAEREDYTYISDGDIIRAGQALDMYYANRYLSNQITLDQGMLWPRDLFIDNNGFKRDAGEIPKELQTAQIEMAMIEASGTSLVQVTSKEDDVKQESVNIGKGAVQESKTYFSPGTVNASESVAAFMASILHGRTSNNGVRIK